MFSTINYKPLFDIRVLHEYFLTEQDGNSVFDLALQQDRLDFLYENFTRDQPTINSWINLSEFPQTSKYPFKIIPVYSGFRIMIPVNAEKQADDSVLYLPRDPIDPDFCFQLQLSINSSAIFTNSNTPLFSALPAHYFFSNKSLVGSPLLPSLSVEAPLKQAGVNYEQGQLAVDPVTNQLQSFALDHLGNSTWTGIAGSAFLNENDRLLIPHRFNYRFNPDQLPLTATIILRNSSGDELFNNFYEGNDQPLKQVPIDLSTAFEQGMPGFNPLLPELFQLEITTGSGFNKTYPVMLLNQEEFAGSSLGLIAIYPETALPLFNLLDPQGFLQFRKSALGAVIQHAPCYEIRIKSRPTFWRYRNNKGLKLLPNPILDDFLFHDPIKGESFSKTTRALTSTPTRFKYNGNTRILPNPPPESVLRVEGGRIYSDMLVPKSSLFET